MPNMVYIYAIIHHDDYYMINSNSNNFVELSDVLSASRIISSVVHCVRKVGEHSFGTLNSS